MSHVTKQMQFHPPVSIQLRSTLREVCPKIVEHIYMLASSVKILIDFITGKEVLIWADLSTNNELSKNDPRLKDELDYVKDVKNLQKGQSKF